MSNNRVCVCGRLVCYGLEHKKIQNTSTKHQVPAGVKALVLTSFRGRSLPSPRGERKPTFSCSPVQTGGECRESLDIAGT